MGLIKKNNNLADRYTLASYRGTSRICTKVKITVTNKAAAYVSGVIPLSLLNGQNSFVSLSLIHGTQSTNKVNQNTIGFLPVVLFPTKWSGKASGPC